MKLKVQSVTKIRIDEKHSESLVDELQNEHPSLNSRAMYTMCFQATNVFDLN